MSPENQKSARKGITEQDFNAMLGDDPDTENDTTQLGQQMDRAFMEARLQELLRMRMSGIALTDEQRNEYDNLGNLLSASDRRVDPPPKKTLGQVARTFFNKRK